MLGFPPCLFLKSPQNKRMATTIGIVFGLYVFVLFFEEFRFRSHRTLSRMERLSRPLDSILLSLGIVMVLALEAEAPWKWVFWGLMLGAVLLQGRSRLEDVQSFRPYEYFVRNLLTVMHFTVFVVLGVVWSFVHGVSLFLGMVLPFSVSGLKVVCQGFLISQILFTLLVMAVHWRRAKKKPEVHEVPTSTELPETTPLS